MPAKIQFYHRKWDIDKPKAVVMLIHGIGEHSERYQDLGNYFNRHGYAMAAIDLPGHGRSSGIAGHINAFSDYSSAALTLHKSIKSDYPTLPIFLLGHSMGGLISTNFLIRRQKLFKGALLSGTAIETSQTPPSWQIALIKLLSKLTPKLKLLSLDASGISRDPEVVQKYMKDPLVSKGKLSARLLVEISKTMDYCKEKASAIKLPLLIMHGGSDVITEPSGSQLLYNLVSSKDKSINVYEGLFHEIFNEPEAETIYAQMVSWLDSRC